MSGTAKAANKTVPMAIEPYDKVWGVGVNETEKNPLPFPHINRLIQFQRDGKFPHMGTVNAAHVYPEFSYDWECNKIREKPMDKRKTTNIS